MLYYRTHASRKGELPTELAGWKPPCPEATMVDQTVGEWRYVAIVPEFVFAPPSHGWVECCNGWEVAQAGETTVPWHLNVSSPWLILVGTCGWIAPIVLNDAGKRAFRVTYGGKDFSPMLTHEQQTALSLATEIRTAYDASTLPDYPVRAQWAAQLLGMVYCLSPVSLGIIGLDEATIDHVLATAGGYRGNTD